MLKDLLVPVALLGVLASLLLPLPSSVIDFLLVGNLIFALVLLTSTLYISDPLKLSALPSILLLSTLYRLVMNISTTRMILNHGEAGSVIEAFGQVVVQGNLLVGVIVFLIITLIQFIVIAKGSERVAEVSARFTLDALPGKQMSIDADVRSGLIDLDTARKKRDLLQVESRFYGALDGAMKFIKGDAIAGVVITLINILGGFCIGLFVNHLDLTTALSKYTLLTVGDGLLSQIPALLQSLAAGMIVTRVVNEKESSIAKDIINQIGQLKKVKLLVASLSLVLAFVSGLPFLPFATLSLILFLTLLRRTESKGVGVSNSNIDMFKPKLAPVIEVQLGESIVTLVRDSNKLTHVLESIRQELYDSKGLILQAPIISIYPVHPETVHVLMHGISVAKKKLVIENELDSSGFYQELSSFIKECYVSRQVEFIDDIHTKRLLDHCETYAPDLVHSLVPSQISTTQLTEVFKQLIREGLSIKPVNLILQAVAESIVETGANTRLLLERVRSSIHRLISATYSDEQGTITGYYLHPLVDLSFSKAEREQNLIDPEIVQALVDEYNTYDEQRLVLCSSAARRLLRECLLLREIDVPVLAHSELSTGVYFNNLATLGNPEILPKKYSEIEQELIDHAA